MVAMKEQIVSLLEAWCRVRVSFLEWNRIATFYAYDDSIDRIITDRGNFWMPEEDRSKSLKIIEVIPPKAPEYKVGDKVMICLDKNEIPARYWPYDVREQWDWRWGLLLFVLHAWLAYPLKENVVCPYHEGVTYNPLPTLPTNETR